jgi:hypothetical protein
VGYLRQNWSRVDGTMRRPSRAIILAEDEEHDLFIRRYLIRLNLGLKDKEMYTEPFPDGRGCGEQWVRTQYARVVREYRWRSSRTQTVLVILIDADKGDVNRRLHQLEEGLKQESLERRKPEECIVHFVPKRSIETWILCLNDHSVDEETDYSGRRDIEDQIAPAADTFYAWTRPNAPIPNRCVPSLRAAIPEAQRLEQ